jgi:2,3-diketo-5-methylthio-1-phosphopentane phosphatase
LLAGRNQDELLRFVLEGYAIEPSFSAFATWARAQELVVVVASDGLGFYVEPMLRAAGVRGVRVMTNEVVFGPVETVELTFRNAHPICVGCGTCKMLVVQQARAEAGVVAFVGEGHTDRYGALYADLVFAKKHLPAICRADGVPYLEWNTFDDVRSALERLREVPGPVAPQTCPGWTDP